MSRGKIQPGEIVVIAFDIRTFRDGKAHVGEDRGQLVHHLANGVDAACLDTRLAHGKRHVDRLAGEPRFQRCFLEDCPARGQGLCDLVLHGVDRRAGCLALVRRHFAEFRQFGRNRALLAECSDTDVFERIFVAGGGYGAQG